MLGGNRNIRECTEQTSRDEWKLCVGLSIEALSGLILSIALASQLLRDGYLRVQRKTAVLTLVVAVVALSNEVVLCFN